VGRDARQLPFLEWPAARLDGMGRRPSAHATDRFPGIPQRRPDAWRWYCAQDGTRPIYLQAPKSHRLANQAEALRLFNQVPGATRFPDPPTFRRRFPINGQPNRWFVEQAGMMIAKALLDGYDAHHPQRHRLS
jgi:hypothetical protein